MTTPPRNATKGTPPPPARKSERERVALLAQRFAVPETSGITTGIGDDAAVLAPVGEPLVWTVDAQVEGTHFRIDWLSWQDVGWRSFIAAASDVAAMGAVPRAALSSLVLADSVDDVAFDALTEGQAEAARVVGAPVVGGNLARGRETSVTTTVLGHTPRAVLRSGARAGDTVFLAGTVGVAAAGLAALQSSTQVDDPNVAACIEAWRRPRALVELGAIIRAGANAAIDVSDGLGCDAHHIAEASGVALVFDEAALRANASLALNAAAATLGTDPLAFMLGGGEDYALLVTTSLPALEGFTRVGAVEVGSAGVFLDGKGGRRPAPAKGFDHFA